MTDAELKRLRKRVAYQARAGGRFQERAAIVADLRSVAKLDDVIGRAFEAAANRYERGDHLKPTPGSEPKGDE